MVGRLGKGRRSVKLMGLNVRIGDLVGLLNGGMLRYSGAIFFWLMCTKMYVLKDEIYCCVWTINFSERLRLMAVIVQSGTPYMCMDMSLPERR